MLSNIGTPTSPSSINRQEDLFYRTPTSGSFRTDCYLNSLLWILIDSNKGKYIKYYKILQNHNFFDKYYVLCLNKRNLF